MQLPEAYVISKFYQFAGAPKYNRFTKTYQASCPVCREGKSWLKKRRLYYIPDRNNVFCHNCGWNSSAYKWIKEVTGLPYNEIMLDSLNYETFDCNTAVAAISGFIETPTLPGDCINLFDEMQINFYRNNDVVSKAVEYIKHRRLDVAVNRPDSLYLCIDRDQTTGHHHRIVIPFVDMINKIVFYQSRSFLQDVNDELPKYLSKTGGDRALFNINKLQPNYTNAFVFEGPLNAFFCKNSIAVGGIQEKSMMLFSNKQQEQIDMYCKFFDIIWVLDSQWIDKASFFKTQKLIQMKQKVFIWPKTIGIKYKDFNDVCIALNLNEIAPQFIQKNTFEGLQAQLMVSQIPQPV
jgi:hypothetical protein